MTRPHGTSLARLLELVEAVDRLVSEGSPATRTTLRGDLAPSGHSHLGNQLLDAVSMGWLVGGRGGPNAPGYRLTAEGKRQLLEQLARRSARTEG